MIFRLTFTFWTIALWLISHNDYSCTCPTNYIFPMHMFHQALFFSVQCYILKTSFRYLKLYVYIYTYIIWQKSTKWRYSAKFHWNVYFVWILHNIRTTRKCLLQKNILRQMLYSYCRSRKMALILSRATWSCNIESEKNIKWIFWQYFAKSFWC